MLSGAYRLGRGRGSIWPRVGGHTAGSVPLAGAPTSLTRRRRLRLPVGILVAVLVVGLAAWILWPSPRPRPYLAFTACLLTDEQGVAGSAAGAVWAGMQDASLATRAKVQYVPAVGTGGVLVDLCHACGLPRAMGIFDETPRRPASTPADRSDQRRRGCR
jgi:hypothetical protein